MNGQRYNNFKLRDGKRPRPLVLRMNVGDMLEIHFENWLQSLTCPATNDSRSTQAPRDSWHPLSTTDALRRHPR